MIPIGKQIYLCQPNLDRICVLNGVQKDTVEFYAKIKAYSELSFTVDRYISTEKESLPYWDEPDKISDIGIESNGYEDLKAHMYLELEDIGYFIMEEPQMANEGMYETKQINAYSIEREFEFKDWVGIKINCGTADSMEYSNTDDSNKDDTHAHFAIDYVKLRDRNNVNLSFLDQILMKMPPRWHIQYVSDRFEAGGKLPAIDIDSQNLYAVMTSEVGPRMRALFVFDYLHCGIRVYHKDELDIGTDTLDLDTGIYIGFRNLANSVNVSIDNDSIFTRFTVQGDSGLEFRDVNYGDNQIINLDYFLNETYMDDTLIAKMNAWKQFKEDNIQDYITLAKRANSLYEKIDELQYKVPSDASYWKNWETINDEGLRKNLEYYENLLETLQIAVDTRPQGEKYNQDNEYQPKLNGGGTVDHDWYEELLYDNIDIYSGYYTYVEIVDYIIPYIEMAIRNENVIPEEKETPDYEINTNWDMYGLEELKGVLSSYEDKMATLEKYSKDWADMTTEEKAEAELNYTDDVTGEKYEALTPRIEYKKYKTQIGDENTPGTIKYRLKQLNDQIKEYEEELAEINEKTNAYTHLVKYDYSDEKYHDEVSVLPQALINQREQFVMTEDELNTIMALLKDTDYVNSNFVYTPLVMTTDDKFDQEQNLLEDAEDKLSEVSQPQYKFTVSLDNFFRIEEYEEWAEEFAPNTENISLGLLKFIRLGIRDDYSVKLRVISYRWNPCDVTPDLTIEFSNMITSRSGRTDLTELTESSNYRGSKNSIRIGTGSSKDTQDFLVSLMDLLRDNSVFTKMVQNAVDGSTVIGYTDASAVEGIVKSYIGSHPPDAGSVSAEYVAGLTGDYIVGKILDAQQGNFDQLNAKIVHALSVAAETATFNTMTAKLIQSQEAYIRNLAADNVTAGTVTAALVNATEAQITTLLADNAFVDGLQALNLSAINSTVNTQFVKSLLVNQLSVGDLVAGDITLTNNLRIVSENGALVMNGNALQIMGTTTDDQGNETQYVGIQLGYDTSSTPSLILRNSDGATVLTPEGITSNAIADGLIINNMVSNGTLSRDKLNFSVIEPNEYGGVDMSQIYMDGTGDNFGTIFTRFKEETETFMNTTKNNMKSVELRGQNMFFESSNGTITPDSITLQAITKNSAEIQNWYIDGEKNTTYVSVDKKSITIPSSYIIDKKSITVRVECVDTDITDSVEAPFDVMTVYKNTDGDSPYTVVINSSKGELFKDATTTRCTCTVYHGSEIVEPQGYTWYLTINDVEQAPLITNVNYIDIPVSAENVKTVVNCSVDI